MYREHYKLSAEPFRLSVDPSLVSAHRSYRSARRHMRLALEQGDGILVVTGRSGTGKTTLIKDFLAKLCPGEVLSAAVVGTPLKSESVLRMAGYAFGLDAKQLDEATLLCELQGLLSRQAHARALLVIDEAHNLSAEALEQVRMLANMQAGEGPALQIFLVGSLVRGVVAGRQPPGQALEWHDNKHRASDCKPARRAQQQPLVGTVQLAEASQLLFQSRSSHGRIMNRQA